MTEATLYLDSSWRVDQDNDGPKLAHHAHVKDILDRLPEYLDGMRELRAVDLDAYDIFRQIGAPIASNESLFTIKAVEPEFLEKMPTWRSVFFCCDPTKEGQLPLYGAYMVRHHNPVGIQSSNSPVYRLVAIWRDKEAELSIKMVAKQCFVSVSDDGAVAVLRERTIIRQEVNHRCVVNRVGWTVPRWIEDVGSDNDMTGSEFARVLVCLLSGAKQEDDAIRVRCASGNVSAAFTVYKRHASRFFRNRELEDGRKKRILHYVAGHFRQRDDGEIFIRPHYRGAREFEWGGMNINLAVPDWHFPNLDKINLEATDEDGPGMVQTDRVGAMILRAMNRPFFLSKRRTA